MTSAKHHIIHTKHFKASGIPSLYLRPMPIFIHFLMDVEPKSVPNSFHFNQITDSHSGSSLAFKQNNYKF